MESSLKKHLIFLFLPSLLLTGCNSSPKSGGKKAKSVVEIQSSSSSSISHSSSSQSSSVQVLDLFTVTWKNYDGEVLEVDKNVQKGEMPSYDGQKPTRESDNLYSYVFKDWTPKLSAVYSDITYTAQYSIKDYYPSEIELSDSTLSIGIGFTHQLTCTVLPDNAINRDVTWSSSNESIAEVDQKGLVTAKQSGNAKIQAKTSNGTKATCEIEVKEPYSSIYMRKSEVTVQVGTENYRLDYSLYPTTTSEYSWWETDDPNIIQFVEGETKAVFNVLDAGKTKIRVYTASGLSAECTILAIGLIYETDVPWHFTHSVTTTVGNYSTTSLHCEMDVTDIKFWFELETYGAMKIYYSFTATATFKLYSNSWCQFSAQVQYEDATILETKKVMCDFEQNDVLVKSGSLGTISYDIFSSRVGWYEILP